MFDGGDGGGAAKEASQQDAGVYFEKERVSDRASPLGVDAEVESLVTAADYIGNLVNRLEIW